MSDFTIFRPKDSSKRLTTQSYLFRDGDFVGFDEIDGRCTEATHAKELGRKMPPAAAEIFKTMSPGTRQAAHGLIYARM